jgi:hypothetical protein
MPAVYLRYGADNTYSLKPVNSFILMENFCNLYVNALAIGLERQVLILLEVDPALRMYFRFILKRLPAPIRNVDRCVPRLISGTDLLL